MSVYPLAGGSCVNGDLTNVNGKTYDYTYDSNGNRKTAAVDATNVQTLTAAGGSTFYNYAGTDQVELSWTDGVSGEGYWWGLNGSHGQPVLQSYSTDAWTKWHYIERDDQQDPLGTRVDDGTGERHYFYVLDGLGSVVGLIDDNGALAGTRAYDPYGKVTATVANDAEINQTVLGYTGGLVNGDLTKLGKRWYDANTGRFTQQDSLTFLADPANGNRYAYAGDNPVNNVDPTGMMDDNERDFWTGIGMVGGVIVAAALLPVELTIAAGVAATVGLGIGLVAGIKFIAEGYQSCKEAGEDWC